MEQLSSLHWLFRPVVSFHFRLLGHRQSQIAMPRFRRQFNSNDEAVMFFCEKNVCGRKSHRVIRSTKDRFSAAFKVDECQFSVSVRKRIDGLFHVVSFHKHTCDGLLPTIKASWVKKLAKHVCRNANNRDKEAQLVTQRRAQQHRTDVDRPEGPDARATVAREGHRGVRETPPSILPTHEHR